MEHEALDHVDHEQAAVRQPHARRGLGRGRGRARGRGRVRVRVRDRGGVRLEVGFSTAQPTVAALAPLTIP